MARSSLSKCASRLIGGLLMLMLLAVAAGCGPEAQKERAFKHRLDSINSELRAGGKSINGAYVVFKDSIPQIGDIKKSQEPKKSIRIEFANIGDEPLVVSGVECHCPCMTATYTEQPVKRGGRGYVDVTIDASEIVGGQLYRTFSLLSNAINGEQFIQIEGTVSY